MYYIYQEQEGTQVIFNEAFETEAELNEGIENAALPIKFVYDDETNSYSRIDGYSLDECRRIVNRR